MEALMLLGSAALFITSCILLFAVHQHIKVSKSKTLWLPLLVYDHNGNKYLLECRKNKNTGHLEFKNTLINGRLNLLHQNITLPVDVKEQLTKLIEA